MTAARCSSGMTATSCRSPPRKATPKPAPAITEPATNAALESAAAARTISIVPAASAIEPTAAPIQGPSGGRPTARARRPTRARRSRPMPATTLVVWNSCADRVGAEREEQAADRPGRDHGQAGQEERVADPGRDARALRGQPQGRARADRLGHPVGAGEGRGEQDQQQRIGEHSRRAADLDEDDETRMPRPRPVALATPLVRPTLAGSRRACRSSRAALAALSAAPVARPWMPRATNSHAGPSAAMKSTDEVISAAQCRQQHRPPADLVGHPPGEQQGCQHTEGVGGEDQGQGQRGEVPEDGVRVVQRRGHHRGEQAQADHCGDEPVGDPIRQGAPGLPGLPPTAHPVPSTSGLDLVLVDECARPSELSAAERGSTSTIPSWFGERTFES